MIRAHAFVPSILALVTLAGCTRYIPNTSVPDTRQNREILQFMETYRHAVEERDVGAITAMVDPLYLDDVGSPEGDDDLDFGSVGPSLSTWASRVVEIRFEIRYIRVRVEERRVTIEYRYTASFKMPNAGGEDRWSRRVADARAVLSRNTETGQLLFLSGL